MAGKKRGAKTKPLDSVQDTNEAAEINRPESESKRELQTERVPEKKSETAEIPKVETAEVPEIETVKLDKTKTQQVPDKETEEVQDLQGSTLQEDEHEQIEGEETLELVEKIVQDLDIRSEAEAFLEADPLYREYKAAQLPKYQRLDVKLYVLLRDDQLEFLAKLTREIMKNRTSAYKVERITKNTIIRALIDNLKDLELDVRNIPDETVLAKRIADVIKAV